MISGQFYKVVAQVKIAMSMHHKFVLCMIFLAAIFLSTPSKADCPYDSEHLSASNAVATGPCSFFNGECESGRNPLIVKDSTGGMVAVCAPASDSNVWANPSLNLLYMPTTYTWTGIAALKMPIYKSTLEATRCTWLFTGRFCVRTAKGMVPGTDANQDSIPGEMGNENGSKPRLCAYEDPWNIEEGLNNSSRAHKGVKNLVVTGTIGCIERAIGPLPPAWRNSAWFDNSTPLPTFSQKVGSIFESPKIEMRVCQRSETDSYIVPCTDSQGVAISDVKDVSGSPYLLNPLPTSNDNTNYKDCAYEVGGTKTTNPAPTEKNRVFCAVVTKDEPQVVKIRMLSKDDYTSNGVTIKSLPRAGYMPKPTVQIGGAAAEPQIIITLRGQSLTLKDDPKLYETPPSRTPGWNQACGYIHQVKFCINRPCEPGTSHMINAVDSNGNTVIDAQGNVVQIPTCTYKDMICAEGYTTGPLTVVTTANDTPIAGPPNVSKSANVAFDNDAANMEYTTANPEGVKLQETFAKNLWVIRPGMPSCKLRSSTAPDAWCSNYNGTCVSGAAPNCIVFAAENTTAASDLWYVNSSTQNIRNLNADEAGLCLYGPYDNGVKTYTYTGSNQTYTVPKNCSEITVNVWGGGAKTRTGTGSTREDYTGGAGGHASAVITIPNGTTSYQYYVGTGGGSPGAAMATQVSGGTSWFRSDSFLYATGGSGVDNTNPGGNGGGTAPNIVAHDGENGATFHGNFTGIQGPAAWGGTHQPTGCGGGVNRAPFGGGGCGADDTWWGLGGHGQITVQCTKGLN